MFIILLSVLLPTNMKKVICYWYIDLFDREDLSLLYEEYETSDLIVTADFALDFSKYDCEPDYVVTENTKQSKFYQNIFELIRSGEYSFLIELGGSIKH